MMFSSFMNLFIKKMFKQLLYQDLFMMFNFLFIRILVLLKPFLLVLKILVLRD
jgi:hypothetical protein